MAKTKNKNIVPIKHYEELENEMDYNDFSYKDEFELICTKALEKLEIKAINEEKCKEKGFVYVFVIKGKIFKIGQSITNIKNRIQSYNCGKVEYRINGTNSTTNYFVLQSLLNINQTTEVFAFFPPKPNYTIFNQTFIDSYPPSKKAENIIINDFKKKHKKLPIGCTQT